MIPDIILNKQIEKDASIFSMLKPIGRGLKSFGKSKFLRHPATLGVIGGASGAALNKKHRLKGALYGAGIGVAGGTALHFGSKILKRTSPIKGQSKAIKRDVGNMSDLGNSTSKGLSTSGENFSHGSAGRGATGGSSYTRGFRGSYPHKVDGFSNYFKKLYGLGTQGDLAGMTGTVFANPVKSLATGYGIKKMTE